MSAYPGPFTVSSTRLSCLDSWILKLEGSNRTLNYYRRVPVDDILFAPSKANTSPDHANVISSDVVFAWALFQRDAYDILRSVKGFICIMYFYNIFYYYILGV
jgi:hypothetical protein